MTFDCRSTCLALDIGGANLKASDGREFCCSMYFPLWKDPAGLADAIVKLTANAPTVERWAVTMTGELADCFRTKREGVAAIVDAVTVAAQDMEAQIYLTDGTLVSPSEAKRRPLEAAASNWHALASFVARRFAPGQGMLIDIGSTTTDIIPFAAGRVAAVGRTDPDRLASGELVYTGVVRSPVCAVVQSLPWRGIQCGVAQELFATTLDVYLTLGPIAEDATDGNTADGRPATREFARDRLARVICADREMFDRDDALTASTTVHQSQIRMIADALDRVVRRPLFVPKLAIVSGQGEFLARDVLKRLDWPEPIESLGELLGEQSSRVAPAYALANLAQEST